MNIRDHHSKFGMGASLRVIPSATTNSHGHAGEDDVLNRLGDSGAAQLAAAMSNIAGQLRAAANASGEQQMGFLDALATELESAASIPQGLLNLPKEASLATSSAAREVENSDADSNGIAPLNLHPDGSELLLSKFLDAVSHAMARANTSNSFRAEFGGKAREIANE